MADYRVYGFAGYEVKLHKNIQERAIFAISIAKNPGWLGWYYYTRSLTSEAHSDFLNAIQDEFHKGIQPPVSTNLFGTLPDDAHGSLFTYNPQVDVNKFADEINTTKARMTTIKNGDNYTCMMAINIVAQQKTSVATFSFNLKANRDREDSDENAEDGSVYLLGWMKWTRNAVSDGPARILGRTSLSKHITDLQGW